MRISDWSSDVCSSDLTRRFDFRDHCLRRRGRTAAAVACAAEIIDDQPGTARRECQRMLATEAIAGTGDDGDAILERNHRSEEHTSELQSLMRNSYALLC